MLRLKLVRLVPDGWCCGIAMGLLVLETTPPTWLAALLEVLTVGGGGGGGSVDLEYDWFWYSGFGGGKKVEAW